MVGVVIGVVEESGRRGLSRHIVEDEALDLDPGDLEGLQGRPDFAQGGGPDGDKLEAALSAVKATLAA